MHPLQRGDGSSKIFVTVTDIGFASSATMLASDVLL